MSVQNDGMAAIKKKKFLEGVLYASKTLGIVPPHVQFWEDHCPYDEGNEQAHFHYDLRTICISERRLASMTYEEITNTATHETTHAADSTPEHPTHHSSQWYNRNREVQIASWRPPGGGIVHIDPRRATHSPPQKKATRTKVDKTSCYVMGCKEKKGLIACEYCHDYYCPSHQEPREPKTGFLSDYDRLQNANQTHPCPDWVEHKLKLKADQDKRYAETLKQILSKKRTIETASSRETPAERTREDYWTHDERITPSPPMMSGESKKERKARQTAERKELRRQKREQRLQSTIVEKESQMPHLHATENNDHSQAARQKILPTLEVLIATMVVLGLLILVFIAFFRT